ncbi:cilia- and flagella-associated protein 74-like isoform X2 [Babylonia areolata]|uniref:cilia- and flagella-associated protein 74-like isoform X2 n=1 Tax=Babylonia areolata TaxID=304850 RepID=UPI003FD507E0
MAEDMDMMMADMDGILDYDDGDDLDDLSSDDEEDVESIIEGQGITPAPETEVSRPQEYPRTPEEKIAWQEQIRMIHLRSHLNQLAEKVKHANYMVDKTREELKKCRAHMNHLQSERDNMFAQIQQQEADSNQSAIYRLRATHRKLCEELAEEEKLETKILERLEQAEYDLALVEVERGKFLLAEDDLLQQEQQLAKDKTHAALHRLQKEKSLAGEARRNKIKDSRRIRETMKEQEQRHRHALEEADRSHQRASKYLHRTLDKMRQRQQAAEESYQADMQRKMDMLIKLKNDITSNRENLKAIRARDKAAENAQKEADDAERRSILEEGGNPDQMMLIKKRQLNQEKKHQEFEREQTQRQMQIMDRILTEERRMKKRKKTQPQLWGEPKWEKSLRVPPHKPVPVKFFEDYVKTTTTTTDTSAPTSAQPLLRSVTADDEEKQDEEKDVADDVVGPRHDSTDSSDSEHNDEDVEDLAQPEFAGLWEQHKPYRVPRDLEGPRQPPGASKMDREILQRTLDKTRQGIVVKQVAAGREFSGCPFYSKPDVIHFKDFDVGSTYKKRVTLTNVSYSINYCKFVDITERLKDFINIEFNPPGQMSAGMTCDMLVTFKPMINEDLVGEVNFLSQTGPFSIPLRCTTKKCDLQLDVGLIDFGTMVIGETVRRSFTLTNRGALGTKFDFFKVTGMKQRTLTTAGTSLGRLTNDSMRGVSPDSEMAVDKAGEKSKTGGSTTDKGGDAKKRSVEDLEKIPEAPGEGVTTDLPQGEGSEVTDIAMTTMEAPTEGAAGSEPKADQELGDAISPDLAVSEVDDYNLDGMRVGSLVTGEIGPFSSLRLDVLWQPTISGKVDSEFLVTFADPLSEGLSVRTVANAIDVPVWVERQTVDLKICMFDRLYQDTVVVNNRATTALRLKFEVCQELKNHLEILPKTGYIQAQSQFSAQLKFLPRKSLFEEAEKYFDRDTGVLEAPMIIRVADQTAPVPFTVNAVVTTSDLEFDLRDIDFGCCTVYESVKASIKLTNKSILPQQFGFVGLPEYVEVQPNDGFGTLLPLETLELDVVFSPQKAFDYKFDLVCRSLINRDFKISCVGVGVLPPLQLSHQVVHFAATSLYDVSTAVLHVVNHHTSSNEFTHPVPRIGTKGEICPVEATSFEFVVPEGVPLTVSPAVGTIEPGKRSRIQLRFSPTLSDDDIRQEAVRLAVKMEAQKVEREYEEALRREKEMAEQAQAGAKGGKQPKGSQSSPGRGKGGKPSGSQTAHSGSSTVSKPRLVSPPDPSTISTESAEYKAAIGSLVRQFKGNFSTVVIPCYVASGSTGNPGELPYSIHNTLYLEVHCPLVKPELVVISDNGSNVVDFGEVSIGQHTSRSITIQNISSRTVELKASILDTAGPFLRVNALRMLSPGATHTVIISFTPSQGRIFREPLKIQTETSMLHLTLAGHGVSPVVSLTVENNLFDVGAVLVGEYSEKTFKIQNTSSLAIDYVIKQDSLSLLRHSKAQALPHYLQPHSTVRNFVGTQNNNGQNVFDLVPSEGTIPAGESKEIMVTFAPDHESAYYSDGIHIELFSQEESHFFQVKGQAHPHIMFMEGGDPLYPDIESLGVVPATTEGEEDAKNPPAIPMLFTLKSQTKDEVFLPATRDVYVCCVRTMAVSQKKETKKQNGEFQFENLQPLTQKGFSIEPAKGFVEAGVKKPVTVTWTPPAGYDPTKTLEEVVMVTLKCDVSEQYQLMLRAMVVSE